MKHLLVGLLFLINAHCCFAQQITSISVIDSLVKQIDKMDLKSQLTYCPSHCDSIGNVVKGSITYTFKGDSLQTKLRKVIIKDDNFEQATNYYFNNDRLIYIKSRFGFSFFYDWDFTVGTIWKDENDIVFIKREREIATAYRLLNMYKNKEDGKLISSR